MDQARSLPTLPRSEQSTQSTFWIRLRSWEYWPAWLTNLPVIGFWLYHGLKAQHPFFFSAANPAIETGGVLGESKSKILDQVPAHLKPQTLFLDSGISGPEGLQQIQVSGLQFPIVAKPDVGERGLGVEKIDTSDLWLAYRKQVDVPILVQEYVDFQEEYSVLYVRLPGESKGKITSLCHKIHLQVRGNGIDTLEDLIKSHPRALLKWEQLAIKWKEELKRIPVKGEKVVLVPIGNHARGAMFLNANDQIDEGLLSTFDQLHEQLEGIYLCRYDLKCTSLDDLKAGKNFKILEINGVLGEPAHIYDPNYSVKQAYRDLFTHWTHVYEVAKAVHQSQGIPYLGFKEALKALFQHLAYLRKFPKL